MSSTTLRNAIEAQREMLIGPTNAEIAAICKALVRHAEATGIKPPSTESLYSTWLANCRDMPAVLLASGLAEVLKHWANTFCLPAPGAVWEAIKAPHCRMCKDLDIMEKAQAMTLDADSPDALDRAPTVETDRIIAETLAVLRAAGRGKRAA